VSSDEACVGAITLTIQQHTVGTGKVLQELLLDGKATSADISRLG